MRRWHFLSTGLLIIKCNFSFIIFKFFRSFVHSNWLSDIANGIVPSLFLFGFATSQIISKTQSDWFFILTGYRCWCPCTIYSTNNGHRCVCVCVLVWRTAQSQATVNCRQQDEKKMAHFAVDIVFCLLYRFQSFSRYARIESSIDRAIWIQFIHSFHSVKTLCSCYC